MCAVLRGEAPAWPNGGEASSAEAFVARADYHGLQPLLYACLHSSDWPPAVLQFLRKQSLGLAMWELSHQQAVTRMLAVLAAVGVRPVLFKGTALAYSLYPSPVWRTRGDTDLIVSPDVRTRVDAALEAEGFVRDVGVSGELVSYQACYSWEAQGGGTHTLDLHWRVNNSELLARLFTHEELLREAHGVSRLGPHALMASPVHAMLLACMHRATHKQNPIYVDGVAHYGGDRLIWLYDIHLLSGVFTTAQWDEFLRLADDKGLRGVCLEGMEQARARFHTAYPARVLGALSRAGAAEPATTYLGGSRARQQWMDFCAIDGKHNKIRFLRESVFPAASYMRHKYADARPDWLPWLYLRRGFGGVWKKLQGNQPNP